MEENKNPKRLENKEETRKHQVFQYILLMFDEGFLSLSFGNL